MSAFESYSTPARSYAKGIGEAVADRTINRKTDLGGKERWQDVAKRVSVGNTALLPSYSQGQIAKSDNEFHRMHHHMRQASLLMSGRHLQHGDDTQASRPMEVFTNCATSASTFLTFYLLMNGAGVGRSYDDYMMVVDWGQMPIVIPVIDQHHADVQSGEIKFGDLAQAMHFYGNRKPEIFRVPDSREGWAKAVERMEIAAFNRERNKVLLIDFSDVRPRGAAIHGMQGRPASGPGPVMTAIANIAKLRDAEMAPWRAAMYADHYTADCVLVGGARRSARMATKIWSDPDVLDFIGVKKGGFLWSSNNSVMVDEKFWTLVRTPHNSVKPGSHSMWAHAKAVFEAICQHSYHDRTGEPGLINADKLSWSNQGLSVFADGDFAGSSRYQIDEDTKDLHLTLAEVWASLPYKAITNPCGEIVLGALGGYCVIADVVPYHAGGPRSRMSGPGIGTTAVLDEWDADTEDAFRTAARALMRVNTMDSLYSKEVRRTNRIGVGFTGIHEFAWARFGYAWAELVDEEKSRPFWELLGRYADAVDQEAASYAQELGVVVPHTTRTVKPAGTTSKLFGLTEGAHLPAMREYLRWVQFRNGDPLIATYKAKGYPVRELKIYSGTTIVGFPTKPAICQLGMGDRLVTAAEATPEQQYQWLRLLEKWWVRGDKGNQVSYTLKYDPSKVSFAEFKQTMLDGQSGVKACSVMPQEDKSAYEYLPESPVSKHEFELIAQAIQEDMDEDVGAEHVSCDNGACPIDFRDKKAA